MALTLILNGQSRLFEGLREGATLQTLVDALELKADRVAVEWNGGIVARAAWPQASLSSGDRLEVVHFVGGGTPSSR